MRLVHSSRTCLELGGRKAQPFILIYLHLFTFYVQPQASLPLLSLVAKSHLVLARRAPVAFLAKAWRIARKCVIELAKLGSVPRWRAVA